MSSISGYSPLMAATAVDPDLSKLPLLKTATLGQSLRHELRETRESLKKEHSRIIQISKDVCTVQALKCSDAVEKRRRARRNPVWGYFRVEENLAHCKQCSYQTKSVYSTNLKVHLKSHHRGSYDEVLLAEQLGVPGFGGINGSYQRTVAASIAPSSLSSLSKALHERALPGQFPTDMLKGILETAPASTHLIAQHTPHLASMLVSGGGDSHASKPREDESRLSPPMGPVAHSDAKSTEANTNEPAMTFARPQPGARRARLRRHPVWKYFTDSEDDKKICCVLCEFKSSSAYSTNLKMHLRAYHTAQYHDVVNLESLHPTAGSLHGSSARREAKGAKRINEEGLKANLYANESGVGNGHSNDEAELIGIQQLLRQLDTLNGRTDCSELVANFRMRLGDHLFAKLDQKARVAGCTELLMSQEFKLFVRSLASTGYELPEVKNPHST